MGWPLGPAQLVRRRARSSLFLRRPVPVWQEWWQQDERTIPLSDRKGVELHREAILTVLAFERHADRYPAATVVRIRRTNHVSHFTLFLRLDRTPRDRGTSHGLL